MRAVNQLFHDNESPFAVRAPRILSIAAAVRGFFFIFMDFFFFGKLTRVFRTLNYWSRIVFTARRDVQWILWRYEVRKFERKKKPRVKERRREKKVIQFSKCIMHWAPSQIVLYAATVLFTILLWSLTFAPALKHFNALTWLLI